MSFLQYILSLLQTTYFNNTIGAYLLAFGIVSISVILGKAIYWLFENILTSLTKKTQTKLDDILVDSLRGPAIFLIFYAGFNYGYRTLILTENATRIFGNIAYILLAINIAWLLVNLIDAFIKEYFTRFAEKTKTDLDNQIVPVVRSLIKIIIVIIAIISILDNMGLDVTSLIAGLGIGGLAFALAAQDSLKNLFGGVALFTDKPFKVGERIKLDEQRDGYVREIGMRTTKIETFDGTYIIVPNSTISTTIVENISKERARRVRTTIGIEYDTPHKKVEQTIKIIEKIILDNKDTDDKSVVVLNDFAESSLNILVIYWIKNLDSILATKHGINMEIKKKLDEAKINFAFPTRTLHIKK